MKAVKFGSYDMQANGCTVVSTDVLSAPRNKIQADSLAERDGALIVKQQWDSKTFTVEGYLRADDEAGLEALTDTFKTAMGMRTQQFDISHAGSTRRYLASAQNIILSQKGPSTAAFSVQFLSPDGMGWDVDSSALFSSSGVSQSVASIGFDVGGSYKAEPYISVTINTVSGATDKTLTLGNASTLRTLSVTRTWANGDVLEIDSLKGELLINGVAEDYRGSLLSFEPGSAALTYNDEFTTRDVTILANYTRRFL